MKPEHAETILTMLVEARELNTQAWDRVDAAEQRSAALAARAEGVEAALKDQVSKNEQLAADSRDLRRRLQERTQELEASERKVDYLRRDLDAATKKITELQSARTP